MIKLLSSIADADDLVVAADQSTVVVAAAAADPELCGRSTIDNPDHSTVILICLSIAAAAAASTLQPASTD